MVAVGDTPEIFLFDVLHNGTYELVYVFEGSEDASFSTDWSSNCDQFAVASQGECSPGAFQSIRDAKRVAADGFVHLYDIRNLPRASTSSMPSPTSPRKLATFQTTQRGPAGAARKVKFSPRGVDSELLAFTEVRLPVPPSAHRQEPGPRNRVPRSSSSCTFT